MFKRQSPNPRKKLILFLVATILLVILAAVVVISIRNHQQKLVAAEKLSQERQLYIDFRNDFNKLKADLNTLDPGVEWEGDDKGLCSYNGGVGLKPGIWVCRNYTKAIFKGGVIDSETYAREANSLIVKRYKGIFIPSKSYRKYLTSNTQSLYYSGTFTYHNEKTIFCELSYEDDTGEGGERTSSATDVRYRLAFDCSGKPTYSWYPNDSLAPLAPGIDAWKNVK